MNQETLQELIVHLNSLMDKEIILYTENQEFRGRLIEVGGPFATLRREKDLYETASTRKIILTKIVAITENVR